MNKKDILAIAKSLFLQQSISRQLFAKLIAADSYVKQTIDGLSGSFARPIETLIGKFKVIIGFPAKKDVVQIIEKNGTTFKVYGLKTQKQIDKTNYQTVNGWADLANLLTTVSGQVSSPGIHFHQRISKIVKKVSISDVYTTYINSISQDLKNTVYNKILTKQQDANKTDELFNFWLAKQTLMLWVNDIIKSIDDTILLAKNIRLFVISNQCDSIISGLTQLREQLQIKTQNYKDNNVQMLIRQKKNNIQGVIKQIQDYIRDNKIVQQFISQRKETNFITSSTSNVLSAIAQNVDQLQQIVSFLQNNKENDFASKLLNAINQSNNANQLISNCDAFGFDCTKKFKEQFENNALIGFQKNMQKGGTQAAEWKQYQQSFTNFLKGVQPNLRYSTWNQVKKLLQERFSSQQVRLNTIGQFDSVVSALQNYQFAQFREKYLIAYRVSRGGRSSNGITKSNCNVVMQSAENDMLNLLPSRDATTIVQNIVEYYKNAKGTIQAVMKTGASSVPYIWIENTDILQKMSGLMDAM